MSIDNFILSDPSAKEETEFDLIEKKIINCAKCRLSQTRTNAVPGMGSRCARIIFVGEGPGRNEDLQGEPFVGAAGKFLDEMLASINLKRKDIYITNVVKCRPPGNRDPRPDEINACLPYLRKQTKLIKPNIICAMGNSACRTLIDPSISISRIHGKFFRKKGFIFYALYHPAAALYNGSLKDTLREDFLRLGEYLRKMTVYN